MSISDAIASVNLSSAASLASRAKAASNAIAASPYAVRQAVLQGFRTNLIAHKAAILAANATDIDTATKAGKDAPFLDRLKLNDARFEGLLATLTDIAAQPDPLGKTLDKWERPNGLKFRKISVPLGVLLIIFEARPNVAVDAAALSLMAGNACILRTGGESLGTATEIIQCLHEALQEEGLPVDAAVLVDNPDRALVHALLQQDKYIDVVIPRGGKSLVAAVREHSTIPVFSHLDGICHLYWHPSSDPIMAAQVIQNAKLRRTSVCGAMETLLIDSALLDSPNNHVLGALQNLLNLGCELRGDSKIQTLNNRIVAAVDADWTTEYLAPILAVKTVSNVMEAVTHINTYGSGHTDGILASDPAAVEAFLGGVQSAIVLHNASTQFADGGEFGFGAEIGIATGKLHARGPVGLAHLTTFQYQVTGDGHCRPV